MVVFVAEQTTLDETGNEKSVQTNQREITRQSQFSYNGLKIDNSTFVVQTDLRDITRHCFGGITSE